MHSDMLYIPPVNLVRATCLTSSSSDWLFFHSVACFMSWKYVVMSFFLWRYSYSCCELSPRGLNWRFAATPMFLIFLQQKGQRLDGGILQPAGSVQSLKRSCKSEWNTCFYQYVNTLSLDQRCDWAHLNFFMFFVVFVIFHAFQHARQAFSPRGSEVLLTVCLLVRFVCYYWIKIQQMTNVWHLNVSARRT